MMRAVLLVVVSMAFLSARPARGEPCAAESAAFRGKRDPSLAKPVEPEAVARLKAGNDHHRQALKLASIVATQERAPAEFQAAIDEYVAAATISSAPALRFSLAQTYRAAGEYRSAIEQYRQFLKVGQPGEALRALVQCQIDAMSAELARAASSAPPRGPGPEDDEPASVAEPPEAPDPDAAPRLDVLAVAPVRQAPPWHADTLGWGVAGAGAVATGVGVYLLIDWRSLQNQAHEEPRDDVRVELKAQAESRKTWGTVTTAAGVVLLGVGIVKLAITPDVPRMDSPRVSLTIAPGGFVVGGSF